MIYLFGHINTYSTSLKTQQPFYASLWGVIEEAYFDNHVIIQAVLCCFGYFYIAESYINHITLGGNHFLLTIAMLWLYLG